MEWNTIIVALIAFAGTISGGYFGVREANKLMNFRLDRLENKVDKHNCLVERMYKCESRIKVLEDEKGP